MGKNRRHKERACDRCGRRTRDETGTCMGCRRLLPGLRRATTNQIIGFMAQCREELERRRQELEAALENTR